MGKQEVERDSGALRIENVMLLIGNDLTRIRRIKRSSFAIFGDIHELDEPGLKATIDAVLHKAARFRQQRARWLPIEAVEEPYEELAEVATNHPGLGWGPWPEPGLREQELWRQAELLMGHFQADERFQSRLEELTQLPRMGEYDWYLLQAMAFVDHLKGWSRQYIESEINSEVSQCPPLNDLVRYRKAVLALAQDFGLRCWWSPKYVHELAHRGKAPDRFSLSLSEDLLLPLAITVTDETKWTDLKDLVKTQLQERKSEVLDAMDGVVDRIKRRLDYPLDELHIKWLYQRLALGWKYGRIWLHHEGKDWVGNARYLDEAVRGGPVGPAVRKVARRLGIKLRRIRGK